MHWHCPNCRESIEPSLDVCWQCGTARDGSVDPTFALADDYEPPIAEEKPQFHLGTMLKLMAAGCLVFAMCGTFMSESWNPLAILFGLAGLVFLGLYLFSWVLLNKVRDFQRDVRQSVRQTETERRSFED